MGVQSCFAGRSSVESRKRYEYQYMGASLQNLIRSIYISIIVIIISSSSNKKQKDLIR